jgi:hypothetical protein|tara:strand:+ start:206 stop:619 length:414 start_codon:yes stop_codon:yes gene_type:complete
MAYFAKLNELNEVTQVIAVADKDTQDENGNEVESVGITFCINLLGGTWKRTSYNMYGGNHKQGKTPFRKNYAGIGWTYNETKDAFIPPKLYESWTLNESTCLWNPPIPKPTDETVNERYVWSEDTLTWNKITIENSL